MTADVVSRNPATLGENGRVPAASPEDVRDAVAAARAAQPAWAALGVDGRLDVLKRVQRAILARRHEIAETITRETGKPIGEALVADVLPVLESITWLRSEGRRVLAGERFRNRILIAKDRTSRIRYDPLGVIGIVAPWNYPFGIPGAQTTFALAAGNAVVMKPATYTTLTALKLRECLTDAAIPEDVVRVVPGAGRTVGNALAESDVDHLVFTGSVSVGAHVERVCSGRGVSTCMELGGSDPTIVLSDADVATAASGITWGRFSNAGQTCAAPKRCFVEAGAYDGFVDRLVGNVRQLRVGDGSQPGVDVGPVIDAAAVDDMQAFVDDAVKRGARVAVGGARVEDLAGHFFQPTVLVDVPEDARVLKEEVFGPVLPVVKVADEDEAVRRANDSAFGLGGSVWTRDALRGERVAARLDCGTVTVNDLMYTFALMETPWTGRKGSGHGVTHGKWGLYEFVRMQHVNVAPATRPLKELWWFPYEDASADTFDKSLEFLYGGVGGAVKTALPMGKRLLSKKNL